MTQRAPRLLVVAACLVLLGAVVPRSGSIAAAAAPPDLAAMALRPADAGPDYALLTSGVYAETGAAAPLADDRGLTIDAVAARLQQAGFSREYYGALGTPSAADPTLASATVATTIDEFASAAGAGRAYAFVTDLSAVTAAKVESLPAARALGEQTRVSRWRRTRTGEGRALNFTQIEVDVLTQNLVASTVVSDFEGHDPAPAVAEDLAAALLQRIDAVRSGRAPGLSGIALRVVSRRVHLYVDAYFRLDGEDAPIFGEPPASRAPRLASYGTAVAAYSVNEGIERGTGVALVGYRDILLRFPDEAAASAYLRGFGAALRQQPGISQVETAPPAAPLGDEAIASRLARVLVRVGADVATLVLSLPAPEETAIDGPIQELAAAAAACLQRPDRPSAPVELAPSRFPAAATPAAAPPPAARPTPTAAAD